ncbi:uncharacterized protein [Coffea arabica]|uniref:Uncharacterized protein isoform X2 n=1 Tax=Coffea arabica TaxID=13443 RepID=A0ABM4WVI6_COFAR
MPDKQLNMQKQWLLKPVNGQQESYPSYDGFVSPPKFFLDMLPFGVQGPDKPLLLTEPNEGKKIDNFVGTGEHLNVVQGSDNEIEGGGGVKETSHKRIKWTDDMVKLLITALSYTGEDDVAVQRFRFVSCPKAGKWRAISNVMVQRGYHVTPHQCEDKFYDLSKKYRRLNDILGRGTACNVVENPKLMNSMDLSNEVVAEVMKILSSKQLFFKEMCSYYNGNRFFLPHDQSLQHLVKVALKAKGKLSQYVSHELPAKRMRELEDFGVSGFRSAPDCNRKSAYHLSNEQTDPISLTNEGGEGDRSQDDWMTSRLLHLEEQKLQIQEQRLDLEKFLRDTQQQDLKLEKMRLENQVMRLENERLAVKLKYWKRGSK